MSKENPYPAPSPRVLADMCAMHAWNEHIDDQTRLLLEWSADELRRLMDRLVAQARAHEQAEAKR